MCDNPVLQQISNEQMNILVFFLPPPHHKYVCNKKNLLFYFSQHIGEKKEDLSTVISFWSALHGGNMKGDFLDGMGWLAGRGANAIVG